MSAVNIVARMYDSQLPASSNESAEKEQGFDQVVQTAIEQKASSDTCVDCSAGQKSAVAGNSEVTVEPEVNHSAMYRFTMFVRVSGDIGAMSQSLAEEFGSLTRNFVSELLAVKDTDVDVLDQYLSQAENSVSQGLESTQNMVKDMLSAADYGLKSIVASMTSNSWMSSLAGGSSSFMTGNSMADIAKVYLQDSINKGATGSSTTGAVSYGGGYDLQMVKATREPLKIVSPEPEQTADESVKIQAVNSNRDKILERFLQLLDGITGAIGGRVIRAEYAVAYYDTASGHDMEVTDKAPVQAEPAVADSSQTSASAAEEVLI